MFFVTVLYRQYTGIYLFYTVVKFIMIFPTSDSKSQSL